MFTKKSTNSQPEDPLVKLLGHWGRWQCHVFTSMSLVKFAFGWTQMAILFLTPNLTFLCVDLPNADKEQLQNNTCYDGCLKYEYDTSPFDNTIVSEWDLICERRWLASFTQTMLQFGSLNGCVIFGFLADRYGRKLIFLIAVAMLIVLGLIIPFSNSYIMFTGLRTFQGMASTGSGIIGFVVTMESIGSEYRELAGCLNHIPTILGHASLSPIAYYFRNWNTYMLAIGLPLLMYIYYFFTIHSSPRWLISQGKVDDAIKLVTKAAIINKLPTADIEETIKQMSQNIRTDSAMKIKKNYFTLFRKSLRVRTICCCFMWFIFGMTYNGFNQYLSETSPDPFISVALAGLIQLPLLFITIVLIKMLGRRLTIFISSVLCGIAVAVLYLIPEIFILIITFSTLGVTGVSIAATAMSVYTSELYPTVVRNMGVGFNYTFMSIGSMLAPFISHTTDYASWMPTAVFAISSVLAGFACLILPETKGITLPDKI